MEAKLTVHSRKSEKRYDFSFRIYKSEKVDDLQIEPGFYEQHSSLPEGIHYEIEIISPDIKSFPYAKKIHYHTSAKSSKDFICWTGSISSTQQVVGLVSMWAAGSVHTIETGEDFAKLYKRHNINLTDHRTLVYLLKSEQYGIDIPKSSYRFL